MAELITHSRFIHEGDPRYISDGPAQEEYFFSVSHCQKFGENFPHRDELVPTSYSLPMRVAPRKDCEDGVVRDKDSWRKVFGVNGFEIPNPDPRYQG